MKLSTADERREFDIGTVADFISTELDVLLDKLEEIDARGELTSGDKELMSIIQRASQFMEYADTSDPKTIDQVLEMGIEAAKHVNSRYGPRLIRKLLLLQHELDNILSMKEAKLIKKAIKEIFAQENFEESHPSLDKYQGVPVSSPGGPDENLVVEDVEEDKAMAPEEAPDKPIKSNMLQERVENALNHLNQIHELFRASDIIVRNPKRKDRMLSQLVKNVLRGKKSAENLLKLLNRKPRIKS